MSIPRSRIPPGRKVPDRLEQLLFRHHVTSRPHEYYEKVELKPGKVYRRIPERTFASADIYPKHVRRRQIPGM